MQKIRAKYKNVKCSKHKKTEKLKKGGKTIKEKTQ